MKRIFYFICLSLFICLNLKAQEKETIHLTPNRVLYPIWSYTPEYQKGFEDTTVNGFGNLSNIKKYKIIGGDYNTNGIRFTIGINTIQNFSNQDITNPELAYDVYITKYKSDSVYVMHGTSSKILMDRAPFYIKAGNTIFKAILYFATKSIVLEKTVGTSNSKPDLILYNDHLPDSARFVLSKGGLVQFKDYEYKSKYIYIFTLDPLSESPQSQRELNTLKSLSIKYKNSIISIIITSDADDWKNFIQSNSAPNWIVTDLSLFPAYNLFQFDFGPNGILFNSKGEMVNRGILPRNLDKYLKP